MKKENKIIIQNSTYLYLRLFITSLLSIFTTRLILNYLGVIDFGIYSVIGGIVVIIGFINTVMLTVTNRFIAFEIGSGTEKSLNNIFNICFNIHLFIAIIAILIGLPTGEWYITNYLNVPYEKINISLWVYRMSLIGSVISFLGVPYNGLLIAKENFLPYSFIEIISSFLKLLIAYLITLAVHDKLLIYAFFMALVSAIPTIFYVIYCNKKYSLIVKYYLSKKFIEYKEVLNFSKWVGYGAFAFIAKIQGANLILNYFFGTALNASLGIANSVNGIIISFASNVSSVISPQITKSYATNDIQRTENLVIATSKFNFLLLLVPALPFLIQTEYLLKIWLNDFPEHTSNFIRLIIVDSLIVGLNAGVINAVNASGKIKWYQIIVNTISLFSIPLAYLLLKYGLSPESIFYGFIFISIIVLIARQIVLFYLIKFNTKRLLIKSYLPSLLVVLSIIPLFFFQRTGLHPTLLIAISLLYLLFCIYFIGLEKKERQIIFKLLMTFKKNKF